VARDRQGAQCEGRVGAAEKCGDDLTRENVLKQAITLIAPQIGMLRQGVSIRTSPDNYLPYSAAALIRFDGAKWVAIGAPISLK